MSVFPSDNFIEYSNVTEDQGLPNPDWQTYFRSSPPDYKVVSNGTHCAALRNSTDPYWVPVADCSTAANFVLVNGSTLMTQNGPSLVDAWGCLGAVEPNPLVRTSVAAQVLSGIGKVFCLLRGLRIVS